MNLVRRFHPKASAGSRDEAARQRDAAAPYQRALFALGDAEMAEQVVSDMIVQECVLHCGGPWRGCGIPTDDLCLLAMQGASLPAVLTIATPGAPSPPGNATSVGGSFPVPADPEAHDRPLGSVSLTAGTTPLDPQGTLLIECLHKDGR